MAEKDSIRFLASQLNGLGDRIRQQNQQNVANAMQQRYMKLAQDKFSNEQKLQGQQTAIGALEARANELAVRMMNDAKDMDVTHLPMWQQKAKTQLLEDTRNSGMFKNLPPELMAGRQMFTSTSRGQEVSRTPELGPLLARKLVGLAPPDLDSLPMDFGLKPVGNNPNLVRTQDGSILSLSGALEREKLRRILTGP